jgi:hypothetical protein
METSLTEIVAGFDARLMFWKKEEWDEKRRSMYLIKKDVFKILSLDESVWPSIFENPVSTFSSKKSSKEFLTTPDWVGPSNPPFWENLNELRDHIPKYDLLYDVWVIAASCFTTGKDYFGATIPNEIDQKWKFLGYDVNDGIWISGLTNCGYIDEDKLTLTKRPWHTYLNEYHLFDSFEYAMEFKEYTDVRVKEHSPFNVCGLYLIEEKKV